MDELMTKSIIFNTSDNFVIAANDYFFQSKNPDRKDVLDGLNKVNIFLGANNSGKSRILRNIYTQNEICDIERVMKFGLFLHDLFQIINSFRITKGQLYHTNNLEQFLNELNLNKYFILDDEKLKIFREAINELQGKIKEPQFSISNGESGFPIFINDLLNKNYEIIKEINNKISFHKLYIPTLRGMRPLLDIDRGDLYHARTNRDYFNEPTEIPNKKIFTGFTIFSEVENKLLGKQAFRNFIREYEIFLSKNFFNNQPVTLTPHKSKGNDVIHITFNNDETTERPVYLLGDGLQTIITITYPLYLWQFEHKDHTNNVLLASIEEPELYLHPAMQRKLVEILLDNQFKNIQYMITTHSNHFIDLVNDYKYNNKISFYSVTKINETKHVRQENNLSNTVYNLLGVRPASVLLANKTIWVEGVSDRIYIRHALSLYFNNKTEDNSENFSEYTDYAFVEYGGSNLSHYIKNDDDRDLEISNISDLLNVFLIADDDGVKQKTAKWDRYEAIRGKLNDRFKKTEGREIENYLTPEVLAKIYPENNISTKQSKYLGKKLPHYLNTVFGVEKYLNPNKTQFSNKQEFAIKAISFQESWDDLSPEMQALILDIVQFIKNK